MVEHLVKNMYIFQILLANVKALDIHITSCLWREWGIQKNAKRQEVQKEANSDASSFPFVAAFAQVPIF